MYFYDPQKVHFVQLFLASKTTFTIDNKIPKANSRAAPIFLISRIPQRFASVVELIPECRLS